MEIERKFLIDSFPRGLRELKRVEMMQGYLTINPVVRIRSRRAADGETDYILCIKGEGTLVRTEVETPLTKQQFEELAQMLPKSFIHKEHRTYALENGLVLECNVVDPGKEGCFMYAEVEFPTVEAANSFVPPSFLGRELTGVPGSSMSAYWMQKKD